MSSDQSRSLLSRTLSYMFKYRLSIALTFMVTIVVSALSIARPWIQKLLIDNITLGGSTRRLAEVVGLLIIVAFLQVICRIAQRFMFVRVQESSARDLRESISDWLFSLRLRFTAGRDTGSVISALMQDVEKMSELYGPIVVSLATDLLQFVAIFGIMIYISFKLTAIVIPLFLLMMFLMKDATKPIQKASNLVQDAKAKVSSSVKEFWTSLAESKSLNAKNYIMDTLSSTFNQLRIREIRMETIKALFQSVDLFVWLVAAVMLWVGGKDVINGRMTMGDLIAYWGYMALILGPINNFINSLGIGRASLGAAERVFDILDTGEAEDSSDDCEDFPHPFSYLEFRNIQFSYNESESVLDLFSCRILKGEKVALIGRSGSGKSTVASLLIQLFQPVGGSIWINDVPIEKIGLHSLRENIGLVFQNPHIYSGSIMDNISIACPGASVSEIEQSVQKAGLAKFVRTLEDGYDTIIGDGGRELSGGQKQRIALARIFIRQPQIVILDEFTSALDPELEIQIINNIMDEFRDATVVVISHRDSTVQAFDRTIHLK